MLGFIAYIPYAAVGYCVAALATDVWPTLRSGVASSAYPASRHGMDGSGLASPAPCYPADVARNQAPTVWRSPIYCYNTATGRIEGNGPLNGVPVEPGAAIVFTDIDARETAKITYMGTPVDPMGVCHVPGGIDCGPRHLPARGAPVFTRGECGPSGLFRNNDPNRAARKRARWG